jgi:hypothetical protein
VKKNVNASVPKIHFFDSQQMQRTTNYQCAKFHSHRALAVFYKNASGFDKTNTATIGITTSLQREIHVLSL